MKKLWPLFFFLSACSNSPVPSTPPVVAVVATGAPSAASSIQGPPVDTLPVTPDYDTLRWQELVQLDSTIRLDLRYATANNFVGEPMYDCPRCFLRPAAARALLKVHRKLQTQGYALKMYDCYRPLPIQWKLWKKVPDRRYVADPRKGSMHNRGAAVDLTIVVDSTGQELDMGTGYDYFGVEAYINYQKLPAAVLANRQLLRSSMEAAGFYTTPTEWWHFSYRGQSYPLDEMVWKCR